MRERVSNVLWMLVLIAAGCGAAHARPLQVLPRVDPRVELLSIVFRLAGNFEYNMSPLAHYTADIDGYFAPYKDHPTVAMARKLAGEKGVRFDAVMKMAVHLSPPPALKSLVLFSDQVPDPRWGKSDALHFAQLLRDFYRDTHFERFLAAHQAMYGLAESRFATVLGGLNLGWYQAFYGEAPRGHFNLLLGMNNGGANYGARVVFPGGRQELFAIIGCWTKDASSDPTYDSNYLSTIIHEFNHSFMNPLVQQHKAAFASADTVYQAVAGKMQAMAYGSAEVMIDESLVRAGEILYAEANGRIHRRAEGMIRAEQASGFVWMDELYDLLRRYESQRAQYPTFRTFLPEVARFYRGLAPRIAQKVADFDQRCVHVVSLQPFPNHAQDADPATQALIVTFDKPLDAAHGYSINLGSQGKEDNPLAGDPQFVDGGRSIKLPLALKPGREYGFALTGHAFASRDGYPLVAYTVTFRTKP